MIAVVDYGAGNIRSVANALERLALNYTITKDADSVYSASHVLFPGVGAAAAAMSALQQSELKEVLKQLQQPFLGICLGMQLMTDYSEEGVTPLLGLIEARTEVFKGQAKVPHMGWNSVYNTKGPLWNGIAEHSDFYFVHSYRVGSSPYCIGECDYVQAFNAALAKDNFFGVQFHPEKSGAQGAQLIKNFSEL